MGAVVLLLVALVPPAGGSLRRLGDLRLRAVGLLMAALLAQVLITDVVVDGPRPVLVAVHLLTYVVAAVVLWLNRGVPGLLVLGAGAGLNAVTIALNGGTSSASASALRRAGLPVDPAGFSNSGVLPHPALPFLGDVFAVPAGVPLANVFSIGDVLILLGAAWCLHRTCRPVRLVEVMAVDERRDLAVFDELVRERDAALAETARLGRNDELARETAPAAPRARRAVPTGAVELRRGAEQRPRDGGPACSSRHALTAGPDRSAHAPRMDESGSWDAGPVLVRPVGELDVDGPAATETIDQTAWTPIH